MLRFKNIEHPTVFFLSLCFFIIFLICFITEWSPENTWRGMQMKKGADLEQHFVAGQMVREGKMNFLYHDSHLLRRMYEGKEPPYNFNYVYSPLVAKIASWLAGRNYLRFYELWLAISVVCLAVSTLIFGKWLHFSEKLKFLPVYVAGFPSVAYSLILGQNTFLSLLMICASGLLLNASLPFGAGFILSCLFYKPQILVFLAFIFFVMQWWRVLAGLVLGSVAWMALTLVAGGWQNFIAWIQVLFGMGTGAGQSQNWSMNITWLGFFCSFRISMNLFLWLAIAAFPVAFAGILLKSSNLKPSEILFIAVAIILPFLPYALSYEILLTLPAFLILLSRDGSFFTKVVIVLWWLTALLSFQLGNSRWAIYASFLTLVSFYLLFCMRRLKTEKLHSSS